MAIKGDLLLVCLALMILMFVSAASAQSDSGQTLSLTLFIEGKQPSTTEIIDPVSQVKTELWDFKDVSVKLFGLSISKSGLASAPALETGDESRILKIRTYNSSGALISEEGVSFSFFELPTDSLNKDYTTLRVNLNYDLGTDLVKVYYKGNEKLAINVGEVLCNFNGKCENCALGGYKCSNHFENKLSCHADCSGTAADSYCDPGEDGICDSDCINEVDPDCNAVGSGGISYPLLILLIIVLAVVIGLIIRKQNLIDLQHPKGKDL